MEEEKMMKEKKTSEKGKAWLKQEMRPYRASIAFITVLYVLATAASLAFAYFVQFLVKGAEDKNAQSILLFSGILLLICQVRHEQNQIIHNSCQHEVFDESKK